MLPFLVTNIIKVLLKKTEKEKKKERKQFCNKFYAHVL